MDTAACQIPSMYWEVHALTSRVLARSIAACLPLTPLHSAQEIAVKVKVQGEPLLQTAVAVGDTGRPIADIAEVSRLLNGAFPAEGTGMLDGKAGPLCGSRLSFAVSGLALAPELVVDAVQAALDLASMPAPPVHLTLSVRGLSTAQDGQDHAAGLACEVLPDNTLRLSFASDTDPVCTEISAIAVLLLPRNATDAAPKHAGGCPAGLSLKTEARLVKAALRDALARLKRARPLALLSVFERRMACLGTLAHAVAGIVRRGSADLQSGACGALQCGLPELADVMHARLEQAAQQAITDRAERTSAARQSLMTCPGMGMEASATSQL
ncbi:hypothetical protein WJX81_001269 [Elliptochloris bilobata]|uniref:Uncharacterized protein n=1 Tax=Elliptochloris bilobata TaxID=381761 RepID=A0AAW1R3K6_9CHLO